MGGGEHPLESSCIRLIVVHRELAKRTLYDKI